MNCTVSLRSQFLIVSYNNKSLPQLITQIEEQAVKFNLILCIQTARRFICQYDRRMVYQCTRYGNTLFFSSRQFSRFVRGTFGKSQKIQHFTGIFLCLRSRNSLN